MEIYMQVTSQGYDLLVLFLTFNFTKQNYKMPPFKQVSWINWQLKPKFKKRKKIGIEIKF